MLAKQKFSLNSFSLIPIASSRTKIRKKLNKTKNKTKQKI